MVVLLSAVVFALLWLFLIGFAVVVGFTILRLEKDDGHWRRGL